MSDKEIAKAYLAKELLHANSSLNNALKRKNVRPEEISNIKRKITALDWLTALVLKEG